MGFSATLLKKDYLELSLEISSDIKISISTGFTDGKGNELI
jgi:hypothetical protein